MGARAHLRASLALCALFLAGGLVLEAALGGRLRGYMDDPILREFARLGHAHGGVLALLSVGLGWATEALETPEGWARPARAAALVGALTVGLGFVLGGLTHGPTDPGPWVLLVPAGALAILAALVVVVLTRPGDRSPLADRDADASG